MHNKLINYWHHSFTGPKGISRSHNLDQNVPTQLSERNESRNYHILFLPQRNMFLGLRSGSQLPIIDASVPITDN